MDINIRENQKLVEVWLTAADQEDNALQSRLKPMYQEYKKKGYLVAVFRSGRSDLYQQTHDLLRFNRKRIAQMEVQREKLLKSPH